MRWSGCRSTALPPGGMVASGSVRRRAQLAAVRPDLTFVELRGNIHTRLGKLPDGGSLVMAVAALQILGLTERIAEELDVATFVPAPGQGCVAAECRTDDGSTAALLAGDRRRPDARARSRPSGPSSPSSAPAAPSRSARTPPAAA